MKIRIVESNMTVNVFEYPSDNVAIVKTKYSDKLMIQRIHNKFSELFKDRKIIVVDENILSVTLLDQDDKEVGELML